MSLPAPVPPTSSSAVTEMIRLAQVPGEYAFYRWGNVAINIWSTQPTASNVKCLADLTENSKPPFPEGISSVHWMAHGAGLPTAGARTGLREIAQRYDDHIACVGVVIDGGGFWASALRSALNGIVMTTNTRFVPRLYGSLDGLVDWLPEAHQRGTGVRIHGSALRGRIMSAVRETIPDYRST